MRLQTDGTIHHTSNQAAMASEAGDEEASTAASVGSEGGGVNSSSNSSVKATGGDDDVMVVEDQQEAPGEGDKQEQQKLPDGWTVHSICKRPYDATIYEEVVGGRPGQDPSTAHAYVVWHKEGKTPLCLICPQHKQHTGKSPYPGNFLGHLRTHKEFTDYEAGRGKGDGKSGKGGGGACTCGGGGTVKWSKERKARVRRLLICMLVVHGRCVLHVCDVMDVHGLRAQINPPNTTPTKLTHARARKPIPTQEQALRDAPGRALPGPRRGALLQGDGVPQHRHAPEGGGAGGQEREGGPARQDQKRAARHAELERRRVDGRVRCTDRLWQDRLDH